MPGRHRASQFWELKETLRIRFGVAACQAGQLRQTRAYEHDRKVELHGAMDGADECSQFIGTQILNVVDREHDARISMLSRPPRLDEEIAEVVREVTRVSDPRQSIDIQG